MPRAGNVQQPRRACPCCTKRYSGASGLVQHLRTSACASKRLTADQLGELQYRYCATPGCRYLHPLSRACKRCQARNEEAAGAAAALDAEAELAAEYGGQQAGQQQPQAAPDQPEPGDAQQPAPADPAAIAVEQPFSSSIRPGRFVPREAHAAFAEAAVKRIDSVMAEVERNDHARLEQRVHALLSLPGEVLTEQSSSKSRARKTCARLRNLNLGLPVYGPAQDAEQQRRRRQQSAAQRQAQRVHRALSHGQVSRAAAALDSAPLSEYDAELHPKLAALHPEAAPPEVPAAVDDPAVKAAAQALITEEVLLAVLPKLPKASAGGPSGWTYEHVKVIVESGQAGLEAVHSLVSTIVSGQLPALPELTDARLLAFEKPGGGVRPIAIGEVWYRLAGLCALKALPNVGKSLAPLQLGVSTRGGSQSIGHAAHAALAADAEAVLFLLDLKNAFGTLDRTEMLKQVAKLAPALLPLVVWAYRNASRLWVNGAPDGTPPLWSQSGVRQGDPLGPLLFALVMQIALLALRDQHPDAPAVAFLDDATIVALADPGVAAVRTFFAECEPLKLLPALGKCLTHSRTPANAAAAAEALGFEHRPEGVIVVGTPIGSDDFVRAHVGSKAEKTKELVATMMDLPLPAQDKMLLLRMSLSRKLAHLPRTVEGHLLEPALSLHEAHLHVAAQGIIGVERDELGFESEWQLGAPTRHGGLGLHVPEASECAAAFIAGAALAQNTLQTAPEQLQPFAGPQGEHLRGVWSGLVDAHPAVWDAELRDASDAVVAKVMPLAQRKLTRALADADAEEVLERVEARVARPAEATLALQTLARLRSVACRPASAFLDALPVAPTLRLSDRDFRSALQLRLGLLEVLSAAVGLTCGCNRKLRETDAEHALVCKLLSGAFTLRHDILVGLWCRAASRAGVASSKEPVLRQLQQQGQAARRRARGDGLRGDALLVLHEGPLVIDVSVVHPAAETYVQDAANTDGAAAAVRGARKVEKYSCGQAGGGYDFEPVIVETYGRLGEPAFELLQRLAGIAAASGKVDEGKFIENTLKEMSVALCRGNGSILAAGQKVLVHVTGHDVQPGLSRPRAELI